MEPVTFKIHVSKEDLFDFMLYHNYHSMQGGLGVLISAGALILLIVRFRTLTPGQATALVVLALAFTVFTPLILRYRAGRQEKRNTSFHHPILYELTGQEMVLTQDEAHAKIAWPSVQKVIETRRSVIVYLSPVRAFIWPRTQLADQYKAVEDMLKACLEPKKVKLKRT